MKQKTAIALGRPSLGRPREFNRDEALQIAVKLFCKHGYEGVSIADLTHAMNISPPSLYAAFGGKEALYREALDVYLQRADLPHIENQGTIRDQIEYLLRDTVRAATDPSYPAGCMVTAGMLNCGAEYQSLAGTLTELRNARCREFACHLRQAVDRGELPPDTDTDATSRYLAALIQGIAIQAKDGASQTELFALVDVAISHWPAARCF
jgi:TetR/AcrR family transcriptional regulator, copper-responsive repressor